jgi:hypothetical protein
MKASKAILLMILLLLAQAEGDAEKLTGSTLKGLDTVFVALEWANGLEVDGQALGIRREKLQTDVELRLRKAGIKVVDFDTAAKRHDVAMLQIVISVQKMGKLAWYASQLNVSVFQWARLSRDPKIESLVGTWTYHSSIGGAEENRFAEFTREGLRDAVDDFINVYLKFNPSPRLAGQ